MEDKTFKITAENLKNLMNTFLSQYFENKEQMCLIDKIIIKDNDDGVSFHWEFIEIIRNKDTEVISK